MENECVTRPLAFTVMLFITWIEYCWEGLGELSSCDNQTPCFMPLINNFFLPPTPFLNLGEFSRSYVSIYFIYYYLDIFVPFQDLSLFYLVFYLACYSVN